jgi:hypothetical protein
MSPERVIQEMCDLQGNTYKVTDKYIYVTLKDGHTRKHDLNLNFVADIPKSTASDNERVKKAIEKLESVGEDDIAEFARQSFDLITKQRAEIADLKAQLLKARMESLEYRNARDEWVAIANKEAARIADLEAALIHERAQQLCCCGYEPPKTIREIEAIAKEALQADGLLTSIR